MAMRKSTSLALFTVLALAAATSRAQEPVVPAPAPLPAPPPPALNEVVIPAPAGNTAQAGPMHGRLQLGLAFLPMAAGQFHGASGAMSETADAAFAYGAGLSAGYALIPGLVVGVAPQVILNVRPKDGGAAQDLGASGSGNKEYDLLLRVAYAYTLAEATAVYAEVLPGYSVIARSGGGPSAKGLVVGVGAGGMLDLGSQTFATLGVGYQWGFQKVQSIDAWTRYVRVTLGSGVRF
jgi:hypothetical protein